ncbi:MAG: SPOR domain-containing protein [Desulfuromonadaceae bacterium]
MDIHFSNDSGSSQQAVSAEKTKQRALLLLLLILIGGFIYLYFFTGLIKPPEAQKTVEAPAAPPQIVKMPLPPRGGEVVKAKENPAATAGPPKAAAPAVVASTAPAVKPVAAPPVSVKPVAAPVVAPAASAKPASVPAKPSVTPVAAPAAKAVPTPPALKPKDESKKSAAVKPAEKKPLPVPTADKKPGTTAAASKNEGKKAAAVGPWSIIVGDYVLEEALSADLGRVRKSGLDPVVKPGSRKKAAMNRLLVSEYNERLSAQAALEKLQRHTSDAFVIEQGGKFAVYAGSYLKSEAASSEKERLKAAGFATTLKRMDLAIPSQTLSVGPFASKKAADTARGKLQGAGLKVSLSQP